MKRDIAVCYGHYGIEGRHPTLYWMDL